MRSHWETSRGFGCAVTWKPRGWALAVLPLKSFTPGSRAALRCSVPLTETALRCFKAASRPETPGFGPVTDLQAEGEALPGAARPRSLPAAPQRAAGALCSLRAGWHGSARLGYGSARLGYGSVTARLGCASPGAPCVCSPQ